MYCSADTATCLRCETQCIRCGWQNSCDTALSWQASQISLVCCLEGFFKAVLHCNSVNSSSMVCDMRMPFECQQIGSGPNQQHTCRTYAGFKSSAGLGKTVHSHTSDKLQYDNVAEDSLALTSQSIRQQCCAPPLDLSDNTKRAIERCR